MSVRVSDKMMSYMNSRGSDVNSKFLTPIIEEREFRRSLSMPEKIQYIKNQYNLKHGKGKRKRKK
jgi:hypothetical protein